MINVGEQKVKEVVQEIHEAMLRKVKRGSQVKEEIVMENRIISIICTDFDLGPIKVSEMMNEQYGYDLTTDDIIQIFRNRRMANPKERKELFQWAEKITALFAEAIHGNREVFEQFETLRKEPAVKNAKRHDSQERIAAMMIYKKHPEIDLFDDADSLFLLGNTLSRYFFYDMVAAICDIYGFPQYKENKKKTQSKEVEKKLSYEQALQRVERLENTLERTTTMLQDLQDEFEEQLQASKVKELADFFAKLNSEKYGCILDELLVVNRGVDTLRKSNYELPIEINGLLIMVKKLIQFVRDNHIEPMMKINSIREVIASDVEFCNYDGSPFSTPEEKKRVKVVSPGWVYRDKELQISRPRIKEEE